MNHKNTLSANLGIAACTFLIDAATNAVQLFPAGQFTAPEGSLRGEGPWYLDKPIADKVIAALSGRDNILIDYDHQSLEFVKNLQTLEAAGTFAGSQLEWRDNAGLFATNVSWAATAKNHFSKGDYRYISPLFTYDKTSGAVKHLISVAVTDNPAIKNMQAIELAAASLIQQPNTEIAAMSKLGDLLSRLMKEKGVTAVQMGSAAGIDAGTVSQILDGSIKSPPEKRLQGFARALGVSLETIKKQLPEQTMKAALCALLNVATDADDETVDTAIAACQHKIDKAATTETELAALKSCDPDPAKYVPIETMTELRSEVAALTNQVNTDKCNDLIIAALSDGRLLSAQKSWAESLDIAALNAYLKDAQPIAALKGTQTGGKAPDTPKKSATDIVAAAAKYQLEQHDAGRRVSVAAAVAHVTKAGEE